MTVFVISHNLQLKSPLTPDFSSHELAKGLMHNSSKFYSSDALAHPHWLVKLESDLSVDDMAKELVRAWKAFRQSEGHSVTHSFLALGGRKDSTALPGAPLQMGSWGVDFVECADPDEFLASINWDALKSSRPADGIFELKA